MEKEIVLWIVKDPKGRIIVNTLRDRRQTAQLFAACNVMHSHIEWKDLYRHGYRCVKCTVNIS